MPLNPQNNLASQTDIFGGRIGPTSYAWTAYGQPLPDATNTSTEAPFGYGGKFGYLRDSETFLILCTHRFYDPSSGSWTQRDPIGIAGGQNLYGYVEGDPVNATDPMGLDPTPMPAPTPNGRYGQFTSRDGVSLGGWIFNRSDQNAFDKTKAAVIKVLNSQYYKRLSPRLPSYTIKFGRDCDGSTNKTDIYTSLLGTDAVICLDPRKLQIIQTISGWRRMPLDQAFAHELGHVAGIPDPFDDGSPLTRKYPIVEHYENTYAREIGYPDRTRYWTNGIPQY